MEPSKPPGIPSAPVNSSTPVPPSSANEVEGSVSGKNRLQQTVTTASVSEPRIPERQGVSPHLDKPSGQNFEQVTAVEPQKTGWTSWLSGWFYGSKVSSTDGQAKLPEPDDSTEKKTTQLSERSAEARDAETYSLWDFLPTLPEWLSGSSVKSTHVEPEVVTGKSSSAHKTDTELTDRSVEETKPQPSLWQRLMNQAWFRGSEVKPTSLSESQKGYIPPSERSAPDEPGGMIKSIKDWGTSLISYGSWLNQVSDGLLGSSASSAMDKVDDAISYFTGNSFAGHTREFMSRGGVTLPGVSDEEFQAIVGKIASVMANTVQDARGSVEIEIPTLEINTGQLTPLRVKGLKARIKLLPVEQDCALIQTQRFQRTIELHDLSCKIELPRADQLPATLDIAIPKGSLTVGSDLLDVISVTGIAKALTSSNRDQLPFDHTAVQLKAASLKVDFDKLNAALPFDPLAPNSLTDPGIIGFHKGTAKFKDFSFTTPLSLLRKAPELTTVHCGGFELTNESNRDPLVQLRKIDVSNLSQQMSGRLKLDIGLDLRKLKHFAFTSLVPKRFLNIQLNCQADLNLVEGEVDIQQAKRGIKLTPAASNWWSKKICSWLNEAMASDKTQLVTGKDGKPRVHLHIGLVETLRGIPRLGKHIPNEFPLPLTGLIPSEEHQGRFVVTDLLSDIVGGLQSSWFGIPGKAQLVRKDDERLCQAAAGGSLPVSKTLFTRAIQLESSGHHGEACRMLEAIPYTHYAQISEDSSLCNPGVLSTMAHHLAEVDPDKAIAVYGLSLRQSSIGVLPQGYNQEGIMESVAKLDLGKPNELEVATDVYEFLAATKPESNALSKLYSLCKNNQYSAERMASLLPKVIDRPPFAGNLGLQAGLLREMESLLGDKISNIIACVPTAGITDQFGVPAQDVADILEPLMMKYGHFVQAARMFESMKQTEKARKILEDAIADQAKEAPQALNERIISEIFHGTYGNPRYVSAYNLLLDLGKKTLLPTLEQNRQHLLKVLWRETRGQNIQWPHNNIDSEASTAAIESHAAIHELFSITEQQHDSSETLHQTLTAIKAKLDSAMANSLKSEAHYSKLQEFSHLTKSLIDDVNIAIQLANHLGFDRKQEPPQRTPRTNSRQP